MPAPPPRAEILGIPLAVSGYDEVVAWMDTMIEADARGWLTAAAVNLVMSARADAGTGRRWPYQTASRWFGRCACSATRAPRACTDRT
jgi:hypothetical protein